MSRRSEGTDLTNPTPEEMIDPGHSETVRRFLVRELVSATSFLDPIQLQEIAYLCHEAVDLLEESGRSEEQLGFLLAVAAIADAVTRAEPSREARNLFADSFHRSIVEMVYLVHLVQPKEIAEYLKRPLPEVNRAIKALTGLGVLKYDQWADAYMVGHEGMQLMDPNLWVSKCASAMGAVRKILSKGQASLEELTEAVRKSDLISLKDAHAVTSQILRMLELIGAVDLGEDERYTLLCKPSKR